MKGTFIPIIIGTFGTVTEGLLNGLEDLEIKGRVETIYISEIGQDSEKTCCYSASVIDHQR